MEAAVVRAVQARAGVESAETLAHKFLDVKSDHTEKRLAQMNEYLRRCERMAAEDGEGDEDQVMGQDEVRDLFLLVRGSVIMNLGLSIFRRYVYPGKKTDNSIT